MSLQISVVIPVYNQQNLVGAALESALKQRCPAREIVVVDDGSTDDTAQVVERIAGKLEDRRAMTGEVTELKFIRQPNAGPSVARNVGISWATGEYVVFLDSDDIWFPWTLECYAREIEEHGNPAIVLGEWVQGNSLEAVTQGDHATKAYADFLSGSQDLHFFSSNNVAIRRDVLQGDKTFPQQIRVYEDKCLALKLGTVPGFVKILAPATVFYRTLPESLSHNLTESKKGIQFIIQEENAGRFPGGALRERDRRRYISHTVRSLSRALLKVGDKTAALSLYRQSLGWHVSLGRWRYIVGFWLEFFRYPAKRRVTP